jgi:hypothetical protein
MLLASVVTIHGKDGPAIPPSVDLSAIRVIICPIGKTGGWQGTGWLIKDHELVTAAHIAANPQSPKCYDAETGGELKIRTLDRKHDFATMTSDKLPVDIPYIKYSCEPFITGNKYYEYGVSDYNEPTLILRMNIITATSEVVTDDNLINEPNSHSLGMRVFDGATAEGTSGGPVFNSAGYAVSFDSAGDDKITLLFPLADTPLCKTS